MNTACVAAARRLPLPPAEAAPSAPGQPPQVCSLPFFSSVPSH
tara:strand:+ start:66 stop:194 length:129 start_codon:yes stop_codon:yes gene_type:complete